MSRFKIKLLKSVATRILPIPPKSKLKSHWIISDPQLFKIDQGGVRRGAIVVPNPQNYKVFCSSAGKKVQSFVTFVVVADTIILDLSDTAENFYPCQKLDKIFMNDQMFLHSC